MAHSRGFALLEIVLALTLGSLVVLIAHVFFAGVTDGARRLRVERVGLERAGNARNWLIEALGSLEIGARGGGFVGSSAKTEFGASLRNEWGWDSGSRVRLAMANNQFIAQDHGREPVVLADSVVRLDFDYLLVLGAQATWVQEWVSFESAPLAIRVRIAKRAATDTILLLIGPRG